MQNNQTNTAPAATLHVRLFDMLSALSTTLDLLAPALSFHQKRTCLIAARIALDMGIASDEYQGLFIASIFHDIGALALQDRLKILNFEAKNVHLHSRMGAQLLARFGPFEAHAPLVAFHHVPWEHGMGHYFEGEEVPLLSHLIHLADRVEILARGRDNILAECDPIRDKIESHRDSRFHPAFVDAFLKTSQTEGFWLDIFSSNLDQILSTLAPFANISLDLDSMMPFAQFVSLIIDSRSHFTATHSAGVAICAETLAAHMGMDRFESAKMRLAGYLHDTGKLAIPHEYINREGGLERHEMARMRSHSYITHDILRRIEGLSDITEWASFHHERLDGSGYPFHRRGSQLSLGARIMAVADIYTALTEDRPYRKGLQPGVAIRMLNAQVAAGKLESTVVDMLDRHHRDIESLRARHEEQEGQALSAFWRMAAQSTP
jgi:HD-GYP domain-containing protein (c-di-GMP phosphodiesterase class II)